MWSHFVYYGHFPCIYLCVYLIPDNNMGNTCVIKVGHGHNRYGMLCWISLGGKVEVSDRSNENLFTM